MRRIKVAKVLMTFVLLGGSLLSFVLDWSPNHLLNPLWHPHARFHGALLLFLLVAAAVSVAYWTPLFYIPFLLPSSTWWAGRPGAEPRIDGVMVYPNLVVAALFLLLTAAAYWLSRAVSVEEDA